MKIKSFYASSPLFEGGRFDDDKPVCVFAAPAVQVFVGVSTTLLNALRVITFRLYKYVPILSRMICDNKL